MRKSHIPGLLALFAAMSLSACMQTPVERGLAGALAGGLLADNMDENIIAGAAVGAAAGALTCGVRGLPPCQSY